MGLKLSDLDPNDVETVGEKEATLGRPSGGLKLSQLHPDEIESVEPEMNPKTSGVTAAATGLIQGAVPFAGALAGAGKAGLDALTGTPLSDIPEDYRQARDSFSEDAQAASLAHPKTSLAGNLVGGLGNPLFQGAKSAAQVIGAGSVHGLGASNADLTKGDVVGGAKDALAGGAGAALGYGIGKALPKVWDGVKYFGKKALTTLGPSEEAINARLSGKAQPSALSYPELADKMGDSLKTVKNQIQQKGLEASQTLSGEAQLPRAYITTPIDEAIAAQGKLVGSSDKSTDSVLRSLREDLSQYDENISEKDVKSIIQKLDDNINWQDQSQDKQNRILEGIRKSLDKTLKFQNPQYQDAMKPVAQRMAVLNNIRKKFNFENVPGEGLQPTDTTATKMQTSLRENKAVTQKHLGKLKDLVGDDYQDLAKDYQLAHQFENTGPNGSRRTVLGGAIGGLFGHGSPAAIATGATGGAILDRYGGQAVGKLIDSYLKAGNSAAFGKFAPVIKKAAEEGPRALSVTGALLSKDPEFKRLIGLE